MFCIIFISSSGKRKLSNAGFKDRQKQLVRTEKIQDAETIRDLKANHYTHSILMR